MVVGQSFNLKNGAPDGLQPFCRECDSRQKGERPKAWARFKKLLLERNRGEFALWTHAKYLDLFEFTAWRCHWCKGAVDRWSGGYWVDKINPNDIYDPDNCVACCWPCNRKKSNRSAEAWSLELAPILARYPQGKVDWHAIDPVFEVRRPFDVSAHVVPEPQYEQRSLFNAGEAAE